MLIKDDGEDIGFGLLIKDDREDIKGWMRIEKKKNLYFLILFIRVNPLHPTESADECVNLLHPTELADECLVVE